MNATCHRCGREVQINFRARRESCSGCDRAPSWCSCQPVAAKPAWMRNLTAKEFTRSAA
jgi:hypothetical protein